MSSTSQRIENPRITGVAPVDVRLRSPVSEFQSPFLPGEIIAGKYRIDRLIGTGGVGFVVAATHATLQEGVALKFLKPEFATHAEAVMRFTIEARASFRIRNEHVARVLDVDALLDGTPFMVMELLEGCDVRTLLEAQGALPVERAVDFALQSCEALAAAHACHIVHRDIKPENLFVTAYGDGDHIKVLDFGISKVALTQATLPTRKTRSTALTMMAVGTPPYMSPEQVRASVELDGRADLWSLGCVLYELLTGTAPFERLSLMQACAAVLEEEPQPLRGLRADVPEALEAVVMRCLRKEPDARFADVAELAAALTPFGARSVRCAERSAELLAEGVRRSDPGYRPGDALARGSHPTPVRSPVLRTQPPAPPRHASGAIPASDLARRQPTTPPPAPATGHALARRRPTRPPGQRNALPDVARVVPAAPAPPAAPATGESSVEILTESDLRPQSNRWIVLAVAAITVLSGVYVVIRRAERLDRTAEVEITRTEGVSASHVAATSTPITNADAPRAALPMPAPAEPATPTSSTTLRPPAAVLPQAQPAEPEQPALEAKETPHDVAPPPARVRNPSARPAGPAANTTKGAARAAKPETKPAVREEEPDVGF